MSFLLADILILNEVSHNFIFQILHINIVNHEQGTILFLRSYLIYIYKPNTTHSLITVSQEPAL